MFTYCSCPLLPSTDNPPTEWTLIEFMNERPILYERLFLSLIKCCRTIIKTNVNPVSISHHLQFVWMSFFALSSPISPGDIMLLCNTAILICMYLMCDRAAVWWGKPNLFPICFYAPGLLCKPCCERIWMNTTDSQQVALRGCTGNQATQAGFWCVVCPLSPVNTHTHI